MSRTLHRFGGHRARGRSGRGGRLLAAAVLTSLGAVGAPAMAQDRATQALMDQANHWRTQNQPSQAMRALERVLFSSPNHPEALAAAVELRLEFGDRAGAEGYLTRLRQAAPEHARVAELERSLRAPVLDPAAREAARLAAAGRERGFAALAANRLAEAASEFERLAAREPRDGDSLGGLGLVRLRQGRSAEAARLLTQAIAADPVKGPRAWGVALDSAAFATELAAGRQQLSAGTLDAAEALLLRAARRDTPERAEAELLLAEVALRRGDATAAEGHFRGALYIRPALGPALSGLHGVLRGAGRFAEAEAVIATAVALGNGRADSLRNEAARTEDPEAALVLLRAAMDAAPGNPWVRLDLARQLARTGRIEEGRALVATGGEGSDALHAAALYAVGTGQPTEAVRLLERMPDRLRSVDQARLLRAARLAVSVASLAEGRPDEARRKLVALAARPDPGAETVATVVRALLLAGDPTGAVEAARAAAGMNRTATPGWRLTVAALLKDAGLDAESAAFTATLSADRAMTPREGRVLAALGGAPVRAAESATQLAAAPRPQPIEREEAPTARDPREIRRIAEAVLRRDPRNSEARLGAVEAALAMGDPNGAETLLSGARVHMPNDPRVSVLDARIARGSGDVRRAQTALQMAAEQRRAQIGMDRGVTYAAAEGPYRRVPLAGDGQGSSFVPVGANPASASSGTPAPLSSDPLLNEIGRQLAEVNEQAAVRLMANGTFRSRSGSEGLERLREYGGGAEVTAPLPGVGGQLAVRAQGVGLDTGRLNSNNAFDLRRFGTNATVVTNTGIAGTTAEAIRPRDRDAAGVAVGAAYLREGITADIGSTPLGFREQNIVGGLELSPQLGENLRLRLRGERRAVTDSLLSWAGMRDNLSGRTFGGVTRTTGYGQIEYQAGDFGLYAGGGYSSFDGRNVADNHRWEAAAGVNYAIFRRPEQELVTGLDLLYLTYDRNLRLFSFGHGGYFSPQNYFAASVPLDYRARSGNLAYRVGISAGVSTFREGRAPFFPTDSGLQAIVESQAATDPTLTAFYPAQSRTEFAGGVRGDIEYAITPSLRVGALARYDRSADYNEFRGMIYARYRFD
ncbi:cellulose synthase subunit BcsC-related outer membrane protein [Muricoccus radiodurans]|uniref:cellulose synthase subunit BcsC-related outer membrane protein n=1 Tax=Muricoccus radiodurans TaxID=2231721 RepID=UPI003CF116EB